jgi:hypothetical protein
MQPGLKRKSFWRSQKIAAESPVCGVLRRKCAKIPNRSEIINGFGPGSIRKTFSVRMALRGPRFSFSAG